MSKARKRTLRKKLIGCFCIAAIAANMAAPAIPIISDMGVITAAAANEPFEGTQLEGTQRTVTFYSDGSMYSVSVVPDGDTVKLPTPTKDGCTFGGWYTDENFTTAFTSESIVTSDLNLYAKWVVEVDLNELLARYIADPTGYTPPAGVWISDYGEGSYIIELTENKNYKISGSNNVNGANVDTQIRVEGYNRNVSIFFDNASIINDYCNYNETQGCSFGNGGIEPLYVDFYGGVSTLSVSGKLSLDTAAAYAKCNNGNDIMHSKICSAYYCGNGSLDNKFFTVEYVDEKGVVVDKNYYLTGQTYDLKPSNYFDEDNNERSIAEEFSCTELPATVSSDTKITVRKHTVSDNNGECEVCGKTVYRTVTFNTNGGEAIEAKQIVNGQTVDLPTPTKDGCTFGGWYTDENFTTAFTSESIVTSDLDLYAKWVVEVDLNEMLSKAISSGSYTDTTTGIEVNKYNENGGYFCRINLPSGNFKFKGSNLVNNAYVDVQIYIAGDINANIEFDNAEILNTLVYSGSTSSTSRYTPFNVDGELNISGKLFVDTMAVYNGTEDADVQYLWIGRGTFNADFFTVQYVDEDGTLIDKNYYLKGREYTVTPGKYVDNELNLYSISEEFPCMVLPETASEDTVINVSSTHGVYNDDGDCTICGKHIVERVTFATNGGGDISPMVVPTGEKLEEPLAPTKDGYIFAGWYTDEACTNEYDFDSAVTGSFTLYAKWVKDAPAMPSNLTAEADVTSVSLKWNAVDGITSYRVLYRVNGTDKWTEKNVTGTSCTVDGLTAETTYDFVVLAVDDSLISECTDEDIVSVTTKAVPAPELPQFTASAGENRISLTWNAVDGAASYRACYRVNGTTTWTTKNTTGTSLTITGLTSGTKYDLVVLAYDGTLWSEYTDSDIRMVTTTKPEAVAPALPAFTAAAGENSISLKWNAVNGAKSYRAFYRVSGTKIWTTKNTTGTSVTLTGLTGGTKYDLLVLAYDGTLWSNYTDSDIITATTKAAVAAPAKPVFTATAGVNSVSLKWNAVSGAKSYRVYYRISGTAAWKYKNTTATAVILTDLTGGKKYDIAVRAYNGSLWSAFSTKDIVNVTPLTAGKKPVFSSVTPGVNRAILRWNAVDGAKSYRVFYRVSGTTKWSYKNTTLTAMNLTGLEGGKTYEFIVRAYDGSTWTSYTSADIAKATIKS